MPTLWKECSDSFRNTLNDYEKKSSSPPDSPNVLLGMLQLEMGLCEHFFEFGSKGKSHFQTAKAALGLSAALSGSLGKRTKHQQQEYAQLLLNATSGLVATDPAESTSGGTEPNAGVELLEDKPIEVGEGEGGWQHSEWEVGRRLVREAATGEEAALREVALDSLDGGAEENILLEGGPRFSNSSSVGRGELHPLDQSVILALCLDVENSNPRDGLTTEEMFPYVERVLMLARNWMIHSTALLQRSWLEYEKRRTMDRALLQIQALLDQHTTRLTLFQGTYKSIEEAAPAWQRLEFLHCLAYPSQYELKRDLAVRYLRCSVYQSALQLFRELELWDDVVTCYQLLDKPHRAEIIVRDQLKLGETPYMLTALGDITGEPEHYERAWELSNHRYARAKRTLGRIAFDKGQYAECVDHLDAALSVQPLVAHAWYLKGVACMRIERLGDAVMAFTRCVQQDNEIGEVRYMLLLRTTYYQRRTDIALRPMPILEQCT
jgi:tetratricopeptide (TPR) repeat protein